MMINSDADVARAIVLAEAAGSIGIAELLRALRAGLICLGIVNDVTSGGYVKRFCAMTQRRPAVLVIGDDDDQHRGPDAFPQAGRTLAWARGIVLHAAAAELQHYRSVVVAAQIVERMLVIECSSRTLPAWQERVARVPMKVPVLTVLPKGGLHPVGGEIAH